MFIKFETIDMTVPTFLMFYFKAFMFEAIEKTLYVLKRSMNRKN